MDDDPGTDLLRNLNQAKLSNLIVMPNAKCNEHASIKQASRLNIISNFWAILLFLHSFTDY